MDGSAHLQVNCPVLAVCVNFSEEAILIYLEKHDALLP